MNILLISECHKNALKNTRRILDQFAERRGERTWQTAITMQGLYTLKKMLRQKARKNSAIACHWIRGKNKSELIWIVGDASKFNSKGAVPTNMTKRNILRAEDEDGFRSAELVILLASLAALLHDLGKASETFQKKLKSKEPLADPFRHEWVSLRLFASFCGEHNGDSWLESLADNPAKYIYDWEKNLQNKEKLPFKKMSPLAKIVGWLIVSHHRLPTEFVDKSANLKMLERLPNAIEKNWCGAREDDAKKIAGCWKFKHGLPVSNKQWQKRISKITSTILKKKELLSPEILQNRYLLQISRMVLVLADHHYSSLTNEKERIRCVNHSELVANTNHKTKKPNQSLDEHILGVEKQVGRIVSQITRLNQKLPTVARCKSLAKRTTGKKYVWQNRAYDLACGLRESSRHNGFFGINMASTGCGKTIANGRIMYGLANPVRGARFTVALGLRTLTLQTGDVYRKEFKLDKDDLAILVGGGAVRELYEHNKESEKPDKNEQNGTESAKNLTDDSHVYYEGNLEDGPLTQWLGKNSNATKLLHAPVLTCTIDHLMQATESLRGGHHIAPMLRLMTSDLVLDEPDDFDQDDLYALSRLVNYAGMFGSRLLLSSATLPPSMVAGLFSAYSEGWRQYQNNHDFPPREEGIVTAWFDENRVDSMQVRSAESFAGAHLDWCEKRAEYLAKHKTTARRAKIVSVPADTEKEELFGQLADLFMDHAEELHDRHHNLDKVTNKKVSFGLIRMAHIDPLYNITKRMAQINAPDNTTMHLCCYHSRHPLITRNAIEKMLDRYLTRHEPEKIFADKAIRKILDNSKTENHIFVVMATAVAEVGRDHDYDWAIVEPSSMRSIIQLAGRVRRHRGGDCKSENIYLLEKNFKAMLGEKIAYYKPGFEREEYKLDTHNLRDILTVDQLATIDSTARILERREPVPKENLVDLEHTVLKAVMQGDEQYQSGANNWWESCASMSGQMQVSHPFRKGPRGDRYYFKYDEDFEKPFLTRLEKDGDETDKHDLLCPFEIETGNRISWWGKADYIEQVKELAQEMIIPPEGCGKRYGTIELETSDNGWDYHPVLGLKPKK